ncbi:hypothetical protein Avbf_09597 [Armadillidium vulgare]|nr:hypothetical protein Avbf_09597 [Armadillidium vulgare]
MILRLALVEIISNNSKLLYLEGVSVNDISVFHRHRIEMVCGLYIKNARFLKDNCNVNSRKHRNYDARGGVSIRPKEWADPKVLNGRAFFRLGGSVGSLVLNSTTKDDEAVYRCRVDFKRQTTTHFRVNLTVVEPISSVRIQDSSGTILVGVAGPFTVGETPTLICKAVGGDPVPSISWWKNGKLLESDYDGGLPSLSVN